MRGLNAASLGPLIVCQDADLRRREPLGAGRGLRRGGGLRHPRQPRLAQDLPDRGARQRRARPHKLGDDLIKAVSLAAQLDHTLAGGVLLGLALGTRPRGREQIAEVTIAVVATSVSTLALV